jgi:hypothetical protein
MTAIFKDHVKGRLTGCRKEKEHDESPSKMGFYA